MTQDREITLHDGTRLLGEERYFATRDALDLNDSEMAERGVLKIHPGFRMIALAEPPTAKHQWLTPEIVPGFIWHQLEPFPQREESLLLNKIIGIEQSTAQQMANLAFSLRNSEDAALRSVASSYSTRQLLRVARRVKHFEGLNLKSELKRAALSRFLPLTTQEALESHLAKFPAPTKNSEGKVKIEQTENSLQIGSVSCPIKKPAEPKKVPAPLFYHNDAQGKAKNSETLFQQEALPIFSVTTVFYELLQWSFYH